MTHYDLSPPALQFTIDAIGRIARSLGHRVDNSVERPRDLVFAVISANLLEEEQESGSYG
jgi:hypothetical protein